MVFHPTFELVGRPVRLSAVSLNFNTGEKFWRLGFLSGEDQPAADILAYSDGKRVIPFIFGDYFDFAEIGDARGFKVPVTSAFVTWIGNDLRAIKGHAYSRIVQYDRAPFGSQEQHGYSFENEAEYSRFCELVRHFLPWWLFLQVDCQMSKSSVHARYFPCACVEVLMPESPCRPTSSDQWNKELRHKHYVRSLSAFRGPVEERGELLERRKREARPKGVMAPPGRENRSPWGGAYVAAIERDYEDAIQRGKALALAAVDGFSKSRVETWADLCEAAAAIQHPFRFQKLLALLLSCELPPTDRAFYAPLSGLDEKRFLWAPPVWELLSQIASEEASSLVSSREELLVHIATFLNTRAIQKFNHPGGREPPRSQEWVTIGW